MKQRMARPVGDGPSGVSVRYSDGVVYDDIPTIYLERDEEGIDIYQVLLPRDPQEEKPVSLGVRLWPGLTALAFPFEGRPNLKNLRIDPIN
jgi:hypothetical protein